MELVTKNLDHLGLVAGMCDEIGLVETIDGLCGTQAHNKNLTFGQCVKCMIMNGLGFVGRTLYLYSEYFEDKPIEHLLGVPVKSQQIDDNVLGRTLDRLFELGVTPLFTKIALKAMQVIGIQVTSLHLDSTSFHVDGNYQGAIGEDESKIVLTHGYSRDHRPELKQVVLQLITSNEGNLPLFMQAASGNTSDKTAFSQIISEHIASFREAVNNRYIVGDSALFTPDSLSEMKGSLFVSRVPHQIKKEQKLIEGSQKECMIPIGEGYLGIEHEVVYADVRQRWVLVFSEAAYNRECRTLRKNFLKGSEKELKSFTQLSKERFACEKDALKKAHRLVSNFNYLKVKGLTVSVVKKHGSLGRPKKGVEPNTVAYQIRGIPYTELETKEAMEKEKGFFVLATNDMNREDFPMQNVLQTYKSQQSVERGFRFLKSPDFLVSSLFLKKPERIEALLMIMTLCLLIYSAIEHRVRSQLCKNNEFFPDQKKRPSQKPTTRWVFYCFLGLHLVFIDGEKNRVTNLKERHQIILRCLGPPYERIYYSEFW